MKGSGVQVSERISKLEEEINSLQQEKEQLMKRRDDELEVELECRALKGDFSPVKSKVLHFRFTNGNPVLRN